MPGETEDFVGFLMTTKETNRHETEQLHVPRELTGPNWRPVHFLEQEVARLRRFSSHSVNRDSILERAVSSIVRPK